MKADIHPAYETIVVTCSCGNKFETRSNLCKPLVLTYATSATRSTPVSRKLWTPAAAYSASQIALVLSARACYSSRVRFKSLMGFTRC